MNEKHLEKQAMAIAVQSSELLECFQWSEKETDRKKAHIAALKLQEQVEALLKDLK